jgi:hypothetical protein
VERVVVVTKITKISIQQRQALAIITGVPLRFRTALSVDVSGKVRVCGHSIALPIATQITRKYHRKPMADDITNLVLLEHMQAMKADLQTQITALDRKMEKRFTGVEEKLEDVRQHSLMLEEDLKAAIDILLKHDRKLARL